MDFTRIYCISERCKNKNIIMNGAGGYFGGRISYYNLKCPECGLKLMIMPLNDKYEYSISATTEEDRTEQRIKKAREESVLKLAEEITRIKNNPY